MFVRMLKYVLDFYKTFILSYVDCAFLIASGENFILAM